MLHTTRTQALTAPGAVAGALWLQAWLDGHAGSDDLLSVLTHLAPDTPPGLYEAGGMQPADRLLHRVRTAGAVLAWPVLPRPGRTLGWPTGIPGDPRPAVLLVSRTSPDHAAPDHASPENASLAARLLLRADSGGWILDDLHEPDRDASPESPTALPRPAPGGLAGQLVTARLADALAPRAASRRFAELLDEASRNLAVMGLERSATAAGSHRWADALGRLPGSIDEQLVALLARLGLALDSLDRALRDDGAAVTASEARARSTRLRRLEGELTDLVSAAIAGARPAPGLRP